MTPVTAGDLGIADEYLSGVRAKTHRYDQLRFDLSGEGEAIFTKNKLEIVLSDRFKKLFNDNPDHFSHLNKSKILGENWISASQVISYDYHVQQGTGIVFKLYYATRAGGKSLATLVFRDENTAKSFHNTMIAWLSGTISQ